MNNLLKAEAQISVMKLELKKLDIDLQIVEQKYSNDLIDRKRFNNWVYDVIKRKSNIQKDIAYKTHQLENPHMYYWENGEAWQVVTKEQKTS